MNFLNKYKLTRLLIATFILIVLVSLTNGPGQPEFSSFEPVSANKLVDEFTGDFTYNIPLLEVSGPNGLSYPISLSYHSGSGPEDDASWVGFGWTLNPGAINRNKIGIPDDWSGENLVTFNRRKPSITASISGNIGFELATFGGSMNAGVRYNNYKGLGLLLGASLNSIKSIGFGSIGLSIDNFTSASFFSDINPGAILSKFLIKEKYSTCSDQARKTISKHSRIGLFSGGNNYGLFSHNYGNLPQIVTRYTGYQLSLSYGALGSAPCLEFGGNFGINLSFLYQNNLPENTNKAFGYFYSNKTPDGRSVMDYTVEKSTPFNKRDAYIGIPLSTADNYIVSGEHISGGFRAYLKSPQIFKPNEVYSETTLFDGTAEVDFGGVDAYSTAFVCGSGKLNQESWKQSPSFNTDDTTEFCFFRFNNDMGGFLSSSGQNDDEISHQLSGNNTLLGIMSDYYNPGMYYDPKTNNILGTEQNNILKNKYGRSSYIGYHTNKEMTATSSQVYYNRETSPNSTMDGDIGRYSNENQIGEFFVTNKDGYKYIYGLPVYSRNDKDLTYNASSSEGNLIDENFTHSDFLKFVVDPNFDQYKETKIGSQLDGKYATTYLLTEITSPDYIDKTHNGYTPDDYGSYIIFTYEKASQQNKWFRWRHPYIGLIYNNGELSTKDDNLISFSSGEKELYYLKEIKTKTHIAIFTTGERDDGVEAFEDNMAAKLKSTDLNGIQRPSDIIRLKKLEKIELTTILGEPVKTIHFKYDYQAWPKIYNNFQNWNGGSGTNGKLTLTNIWYEFPGTSYVKISPYSFEYQYPNLASTNFSLYDCSSINESPDYSPYATDAWGSYQTKTNGVLNAKNLQSGVNQNPGNFDPAAWQLKKITLPSGGQMHIQYEQDDYKYVQNKDANYLYTLTSYNSNSTSSCTASIVLNSTSDANYLKDKIQNDYINTNKKIYFKFLYSLLDANSPNFIKDYCGSEYITGYMKPSNVSTNGSNTLIISFEQTGNYVMPSQVCNDFLKKERVGNMLVNGNCDCSNNIFQDYDPLGIADRILTFTEQTSAIFANIGGTCNNIKPNKSYLKLPTINAKLGGGLRVKRLLMFDKDPSSQGASLYGNEYIYKTLAPNSTTLISSGVASNEPSILREENVLIEPVDRKDQSFLSKITSGEDLKQNEGPIGENLLPVASVGYSRVITKGINNSIEYSPSYKINTFHTYFDMPTLSSFTSLKTENYFMILPLLLYNSMTNNYWSTQSFRIINNDFNGKPITVEQYNGRYAITGDVETGNGSIVDYTKYEYFDVKKDYTVPVLSNINDLIDFLKNPTTQQFPQLPLGKESEIVEESKKITDALNNYAIEFDAGVTTCFFPWYSMFPSLSETESILYTDAVTKIIKNPAIIKSVTSIRDGMMQKTENIAFNVDNGTPCIVKETYGKNEDVYHHFSIPASWYYPEMGQIANNSRLVIKPINESCFINWDSQNKILHFTTDDIWDEHTRDFKYKFSKLSVGDLLMINARGVNYFYSIGKINYTGEIDGINNCSVQLSKLSYSDVLYDNPDRIEVIKSGRKNLLNEVVGEFTIAGNLLTPAITGVNQTLIDDRNSFANALNSLSYESLYNLATGNNIKILDTETSELIQLSFYSEYKFRFTQNQTNFRIDFLHGSTEINSQIIYGTRTATSKFIYDEFSNTIAYYSFYLNRYIHSVPININIICFETNTNVIKQVTKCNFNKYSQINNFDDVTSEFLAGANDYEKGKYGQWHSSENFIYNKNYPNSTGYEMALLPLSSNTWNASNWKLFSRNTLHMAGGLPLEEIDILGTRSIVRYSSNRNLITLTGKNASYNSTYFESFEDDDYCIFSGQQTTEAFYHHTGKKCLKFQSNQLQMNTILPSTENPEELKYLIKICNVRCCFWVMSNDIVSLNNKFKLNILVEGTNRAYLFKPKSIVNGWVLMEAASNKIDFPENNVPSLDISISKLDANNYFIDDFKLQPQNASTTSFVYDEYNRVCAIFDDLHFARLFKYDFSGKLIGKYKETEKGIKITDDSYYHTPVIDND